MVAKLILTSSIFSNCSEQFSKVAPVVTISSTNKICFCTMDSGLLRVKIPSDLLSDINRLTLCLNTWELVFDSFKIEVLF